jgi:3-hydroxyacyl-CoA dehydrogenase
MRKVVVVGAGTMGSGIAAHLANIGFDVTLLDRTAEDARAAYDRAKRARPSHFYIPQTAELIKVGGIMDELDSIRQADWICEAIVEKLEAKRQLFELIEPLLSPDAMISTNTSGLEIGLLALYCGQSFRSRFLGTHFFNPPRYLKLLELIPTPETDPAVVEKMTAFLEESVARRVVLAKDTPGFIANRFGMWSMFKATHVAERLGLSVEEVDEITGPFIGRPKSGSFRLNDLVGLDIMQDIARNLIERCPSDPHTTALQPPRSLSHLIEKGWIGNKAGQGYYRKEGKEFVSLDLRTMAYRQRQDPELPSLKALSKQPLTERLRQGLELRDQVGEYLREYLIPTLRYADFLKEEISHNVRDFDRVMQWGFGWEAGPFEMIDMIGAERVGVAGPAYYQGIEIRAFDGQYIPLKPEPEYAAIKDFPVIEQRETINLRDLGDGVTALCLTGKMGVIGPKTVEEMTEVLKSGVIKRMVFTSEDPRAFSAGFDLKFFVQAIEAKDFNAIDAAIDNFQQLGILMGSVPGVAAAYGYCFGGGFEMAASCSLIAAAPETQIGLPEARVGLVPGGGGIGLMRLRNQSDAKSLAEIIKTVTMGVTSSCADHARALGYLRPLDVTIYHPDRLLMEAKKLALEAKPVQHPAWNEVAGPVVGMAERALDECRKAGEATNYDLQIGDKLKPAFARATSFEDSLVKERLAFLDLCREGLSLARMKHMLEMGRPLRN